MKKMFGALVLVGMFVLIGVVGHIETHYSVEGKVTAVNGEYVTVEDTANYEWDFCGEGYTVGQKVKIYFDNNCTDRTRKDDKIVKVKGY